VIYNLDRVDQKGIHMLYKKLTPGRWLVVLTWMGGGGFLLDCAAEAQSLPIAMVAFLFMAACVMALAAPREWF